MSWREPSGCAGPPGFPYTRRSGCFSSRGLLREKEVGVELVESWRDHVEIFHGRSLVRRAPQHLDLAFGRGIDLDHVAVDPAPPLHGAEPVRNVGQAGIRDPETDACRKPCDAAQLIERSVR